MVDPALASMNFPESLLRGLHNKNCITAEGEVTAEAFSERESEYRENLFEISINWEDNEEVESFTLEQKHEKGHKLFPQGIVRISLSELERLKKLPRTKSIMSYERAALPDNPYHGNILLSGDASKATRKLVRSSLALCVSSTQRLK